MAKTNVRLVYPSVVTHEGAPAQREGALRELRRTVSTCLLFESTFYEGGSSIAQRISDLCSRVSQGELIQEISRAKTLGLRHAPLWMAVRLAKLYKGIGVGHSIANTITRADELAEFLAMYWRKSALDETLHRQPLTKQMKLGLASAFEKFDAYQFAKYNRDGQVKLRDVMFLAHPKPQAGRSELYKQIADDGLPTPDTWEVALSAGQDKKATWERLLSENKLGALALIRNLRNMEQAGVNRKLIIEALGNAKTKGILPFQFVTAWINAPSYAMAIDEMMLRAMDGEEKLRGTTILVVDVSGSMDQTLSARSDARRFHAAGAIAVGLMERCEDLRVFTFSGSLVEIQPVRGLGLIGVISMSQEHGNTRLGAALEALEVKARGCRIIVVTDEQTHDTIPPLVGTARKFMVNVAPYQYGVSIDKTWTRVSGFSSAIVDWVVQEELEPLFDVK